MMRWEPAVAVLAALALAASVAWLLGEAPPIAVPARGAPGPSLASAAVQPPGIGPFESFDVNADNPFVPWDERAKEARPTRSDPVVPPPHPESVVPPAPRPPLHLPDALQGGGDAPRALGFVRAGVEDSALVVRLPGDTRTCSLRPGETAGRWTLLAIENGNTAVFTDATGRRYRQVIGQ